MIIGIDIGNTNITIGLIENHDIVKSYRLTTRTKRTSDEYGFLIRSFLIDADVTINDIDDVIISSVVPKIMYSFTNSIRKYIKKEPIIIAPGVKTGVALNIDNPKEIGADKIVNAAGAIKFYRGNCLIIDFGTATTIDYIDENNTLKGGIIAPGIEISANALYEKAAKLPEVEIKKPKKYLGKNTIESMQSGIVFGYIGQIEYLIKKIKDEIGNQNIMVIATGGLGRLIANETSLIDIYDADLTFKGLDAVYENIQNKKNK